MLSLVSTLLKWVTTYRYTILMCNEPIRPSQPPSLSRMWNEWSTWQGWNGSAFWLGT